MSNSLSYLEALEKLGVVVISPTGVSMRPLINDATDRVTVNKKIERAKVGDIVLFLRGGGYVLHRVIRVNPTSYDIRGDHDMVTDRNVPETDVIGIATGIHRGEKYYDIATSAKCRRHRSAQLLPPPLRYCWMRVYLHVSSRLDKIKKERR